MSAGAGPDRSDPTPAESATRRRGDESLIRGGLIGIGAVTAATLALAAVGALIAVIVVVLT